VIIIIFKTESPSRGLSRCLLDRRSGGAVAACESISVTGVGSFPCAIFAAEGRDAGREGQGLRSLQRSRISWNRASLSRQAVAASRALLFSADWDERSRRRDTADRRRKNTDTWPRPRDD